MAEQAAAEKAITWRHDADTAISESRGRSTNVLLDFSAAPM